MYHFHTIEQSGNNVEREMHKTNYVPNEEINSINNHNINNEKANNQDVHQKEINNYNSFNGNRSFKPYNTQNGFRPYNKKRDFKATYGYEKKQDLNQMESYIYIYINSMKKNNFNGSPCN